MLDVGCRTRFVRRSLNQHPKSNIQHPSIMSRRRFFVDEVRRGEAELAGEEAEHLTRVLRAEVGQRYEICDGARLYLGEIVETHKRAARFRVVEELAVPEPAIRIALLVSLIK